MTLPRTRHVVAVSLLVLVALGTPAQIDLGRDKYQIDSPHSNISFSVNFMGLSRVEGRFTGYRGTVLYDEKDITRSAVALVIQTDSINTAEEFRDNHLKNADFFDAPKYPNITFQSQKVVKQGDGFVLIGPLTMHGVTKEVAIACKLAHPRTTSDMWGNPRVGFDGRLAINRKDFGIGSSPRWEGKTATGAVTIGDDVEIRLYISARILNYDRVSGGPQAFDTPLWATFEEKGFDAMAAQYREAAATPAANPEETQRREGALNRLGYKLMWRNRVKEALTVFEWHAAAFPQAASAYHGLGEAQARTGDREAAVATFKKVLERDATSPHALMMLRHLGATASQAQK